jgi:hypothetical protein
MSGYSHLTAEERDRIAGLKADGLSLCAIARALGRAASTISRELQRNALDSGAYRPHVADGAYMLRRQRKATIETDAKLAAYVTDRLAEGWTPEQIDIGAPLVRATMATRTAAARDRDRLAGGLHGDDLRLDLSRRPEGRAAVALPDPPPCPPREAPRPGVSRHDRRKNPHFSAIRRRRRTRDGGTLAFRRCRHRLPACRKLTS